MMVPQHYEDVRDSYGIEKIHPHAMRLSNKTTRDSSVHDPTDDHSGVLRGGVDIYSPLHNFDHSFDHSAPVPIRGETAPPTRTSANLSRHMHAPVMSSHDDHFYPIRGEHPFPSAVSQQRQEPSGVPSDASLHNASSYTSPRPQGGSSSNKISYPQRHQQRRQSQTGPAIVDTPLLHIDEGGAPAVPSPKRTVEYIPPAPIGMEDTQKSHPGHGGRRDSEIRHIPTPMRHSDAYVAPSGMMTVASSGFDQCADNADAVLRDGAPHLQLRPPHPIPQPGAAQPESPSRPREARNVRQDDSAALADTSLTPEHRKTKVLDGTRTNFSSAFGFSEPDDCAPHFSMPQNSQHQWPVPTHISATTSPALPLHDNHAAESLEGRNMREERASVTDPVISVDVDSGSHRGNAVHHRITVHAPSTVCSAPLLVPPPANNSPPPASTSYPPLPTPYPSAYSAFTPGQVQVSMYEGSAYSGAHPSYQYDPHAGAGSAMAPQLYAGSAYPPANGLQYHHGDQTEYQSVGQTEYHTVGYTDYTTSNLAQCVPQGCYGQPQVNFPKAGQTTQMTNISTDNVFLEPTRGMDPELNNCQVVDNAYSCGEQHRAEAPMSPADTLLTLPLAYQDVNVAYGPPAVRPQQPPQPPPPSYEPPVILEGWLKKRGPKYGMDWKLRHCVLTADGRLSYWREKGEEKKGDIEIQPDSVIRFFKDPGATSEARVMAHRYPHGLEIFQGNDVRTWYLDAGTREKQVIWHRAITDCIMRARQRYR